MYVHDSQVEETKKEIIDQVKKLEEDMIKKVEAEGGTDENAIKEAVTAGSHTALTFA